MDTFTLDWGRSWLVRMFGRNPLVRRSDRVETLAVVVAVIAVVTAIPVAAAFGTSMQESRSATYAREASTHHQTTATALADATVHAEPSSDTYTVKARWSAAAAGGTHVGTISVRDWVDAGDRFDIWTDADGTRAAPPPPASKATTEAVCLAVLMWMVAVGVVVATVDYLRRRLDRARYAEWDRDLDSLAGNDGGRLR